MERRHDLDWIRSAAFGLLVLYHVGMYYVTWGWHVKSPQTHLLLEPFMLLSSPWRMSLLFVISGAATAFMLGRQPHGFLRQRSWRLLLPLLFGMAVIVPPQSYYQIVEQLQGGYHDGYLAFYGRYLSAYHGFCNGDECLTLPTWNHLWFVAYLWVYTALLWVLWRSLPDAARTRLLGWAASALRGWHALLIPIGLLAAARLLLVARFESTHALFGDWYNHAQYFPLFLLGFLMASARGFWESLQRLRWPALILAALGYALMIHTWYFSGYNDSNPPPLTLRLILRGVWAINQWCAIAAILGFGYRLRNADSSMLRYLTAAVFPIYILHQSVIVVLAHHLKPLALPASVEGPLLILATFALCFGGYELIRRLRWLRPLFGLKPVAPGDHRQIADAGVSARSP